jgi:ribose/xylose/arabinose/galactoside ABC-type transport system permease subunit
MLKMPQLNGFLNYNKKLLKSESGVMQELGLVLVIILLAVLLWVFSGTHVELDLLTGKKFAVSNFMNAGVLLQWATDASFFAIMAVGISLVIITTGIDLSVGAVYALAGVTMAMVLRWMGPMSSPATVFIAMAVCLGVALLCGLVNGLLVVGLNVHPFIITLGTMWALRGVAFVASKAESILVPQALTNVVKSPLGLGKTLAPIPMLIMFLIMVIGAVFLKLTVPGRHIFAVGGNAEASRFAGLRIKWILVSVYAIAGLTYGAAAFLGVSYYGSASCGDATGYELYVIASAVIGGTSLSGGKGSAIGAVLGAILIMLIRLAIVIMHFDQNYEWIIIGVAVIIAVVIDQTSAKLTAKRMVQLAVEAQAPEAAEAGENK